jgi:uncharacterized protein YecE (DUF72 family)
MEVTMRLTIETNEYEIVKVPFSGETKIVIHDYENKELKNMQAYINELEDQLADYKEI